MPSDEPVVAVIGRSPRNWLHSADILVYEPRSELSGWAWLATVFTRYPGCAAAIVRLPHRLVLLGRWA